MIQIWNEGGCEPNPGTGGWGYTMLMRDGAVREAHGGANDTTNNRMELKAILEALRALPAGAAAVVHSDSSYCV